MRNMTTDIITVNGVRSAVMHAGAPDHDPSGGVRAGRSGTRR